MSESRRTEGSWLGDLIRALGELDASDEQAARIAVMLNLRSAEVKHPAISATTRTTDTATVTANATVTPTIAGAAGPTAAQRPADQRNPATAPSPGQQRVDASATVAPGEGEFGFEFVGTDSPPAHWISDVDELEPPGMSGPYDATVPSFVPLLAPGVTRATLAEAAATWTNGGPLDLGRLIQDVAMRRPVRALPYLPMTTLRRGAQILVDRATSMQPFQSDADDLAARIQEVTSQGATQLLYFDQDPAVVNQTWPVRKGRPHELPPSGTPIIVITDLGIRALGSDRARAQPFWMTFAIQARRRRCPIIAFVPYPPSRWPRGLHGLVTSVPWDRKTSVATVRAARRGEDRG